MCVEVFCIGFSFHTFKIQLSQTLQRYVIFTFFIYMHVHGQPEHVMRILLMNIMCMGTNKRFLKMSFIGDFGLQNVRSNLQRQTKKKSVDVFLRAGSFALKFLNSGACRNWKEAFYYWNQNSSSVFRVLNIDVFIVRLTSASERVRTKLILRISNFKRLSQNKHPPPPIIKPACHPGLTEWHG